MPRKLENRLTDENYISKVIKRSRENKNTLGDLCRFDMEGVEIPPDELFAMLKKYNLEKWSPVDIRPRTAARKAITRVKQELEDPENDMRIIVRPVRTHEKDVSRYAIIDETTDQANLDLDFETRNQVVFRADTETIEFTKDPIPEIIKKFHYLCSVYTDVEIKHMVHNIITNHGCVEMNDGSGMYFIGHGTKHLADSLVSLFEELKERTTSYCYFRPIAILNDENNRATMGEAVIAEVTMELNEATEYLNKAGSDNSKKSLNAALRRFKAAQSKARLYKDMLELNIESVTKQVDSANTKATEIMTQITEEQERKRKEAKANGN